MPDPQEIIKVIDEVPHTWVREPDADGVVRRGGHWQPVQADLTQQEQKNWEHTKTAGMIAGGFAGGMALPAMLPALAEAGPIGAALTRIIGAAMGGGGGRAAAHVPEALEEQRTGQPSGSTFLGEGTRGAGEMAAAEALPIALGPAAKVGGSTLKWLGTMAADNPAASAAARATMAWRRGLAATPVGYWLGGPGGAAAADAIAGIGPVVANKVGQGLENLSTKLGTKTLTQRMEPWLKALVSKFGPYEEAIPALTREETVAANAYKGTARRAARSTRQAAEAAREATELTPENFGTTVPVTKTPVAPDTPVFGDPHGLEDLTSQYHADVAAGFEPNQASRMNFGESRPGGSSLPRANSWNPSEVPGQPTSGITLSDAAAEQLGKTPEPWKDLAGAAALGGAGGGSIQALYKRTGRSSPAAAAAQSAEDFVPDASQSEPARTPTTNDFLTALRRNLGLQSDVLVGASPEPPPPSPPSPARQLPLPAHAIPSAYAFSGFTGTTADDPDEAHIRAYLKGLHR